ncbi:MAG: 3-isopropylmalate dehydratase small subunit [Anaerolineae bacterium]|nr:3-isopropylmalate dehydratase small subunit [Anaerolineae bacterium]MDW8097988.1 3-isopropylmalate dehydratase small subunit [Anaerolineae bacterium]
MEPFTSHTGTAVPLRAENVDTDQIIPARYLTTVTREGLGEGLFADWRRNADGTLRADFPLNQPQYQGATILIAGPNFGCGSSREHAPWALLDYGFRVVISPGFADIFYNNSLKNGLLPVQLPMKVVNLLWDLVEEMPATRLTVDLFHQSVSLPDGRSFPFEIDSFRKMCLLQGVDDLGYLLAKEPLIAIYEACHGK